MTKKNLRKIIIDGETYLWKREHHHVEKNTSYCQEQLTVYLEKNKKSPLRIYFNESGTKQNQALKWEIGYPAQGVLCLNEKNSMVSMNLNKPKIVSLFIHYFRKHGWDPLASNSPYEIQEGLNLLDKINPEVEF